MEFYKDIHKITNPDSLNVLVNKFNQFSEDYIPKDLEKIAPYFNPEGLQLRHDARIAFEDMAYEANKEGIHLRAISTYRSYYYQWKVYLNNITPYISIEEYRKVRDKVSARPGHSEHQTGLAIDINDLEQTFANTPEGKWLTINSFRYGFILRYPKGKEAITGYDYEPWHFRYLGRELAEAVYFSNMVYDQFYSLHLDYNRMR
ncbi:MAG: M15 family metallopeptidase [Herbinix sp.]|nr:M15 family metallopeptidase [Herbinix sp.]